MGFIADILTLIVGGGITTADVPTWLDWLWQAIAEGASLHGVQICCLHTILLANQCVAY